MASLNTEQQQTPIVDETSISPIRPNHERKNFLNNHLLHRPERAQLIESEPPLQASLIAPEDYLLTTRPPTENILPASSAAPGLLAHQKEVSQSINVLLLSLRP